MIFISEIGMNYNGNFDLCYELIKKSKLSEQILQNFKLAGEIKRMRLII